MPNNKPLTDDYQIATQMRSWYEDARDRGHKTYIAAARECERMYTPGEHWTDAEKDYFESVGRVPIEVNGIFNGINTIIGEQIYTRVDVTCRPKKAPANQETAEILSKLFLHIKDQTNFSNIETIVSTDGAIRKRGFYDVRMMFDENMRGEINIEDVDPFDVLPDPDAQSYSPAKWRRVQRTRWLSLDEIEGLYGVEVRRKAEERATRDYTPWGVDEATEGNTETRNSFGDQSKANVYQDYYADIAGQKSVRVIETQHRKMNLQLFFVGEEGDLRPVPSHLTKQQAQEFATLNNLQLTKQNKTRVRWTVTTYDTVLMDEWSPYDEFTIIPYFPFFNRGKTIGMVDNAIGAQRLLDGSLTSYLHIVKSTANSGWINEEDSLVDTTKEDLEDTGNKTGLVLTVKAGKRFPEKIQPNQIPTGMDRLIDRGEQFIKNTIGVSDAEQGQESPEVSGVAIQAKVFQGKLQRALPMDNLALTRLMVFSTVLKRIQEYYTEQRIIKIAGKDTSGNATEEEVVINQMTPEGQILNDVTLGEYEIVLDVVPTGASFEAQEFQQLLKMREIGITSIPDEQYILKSNITDKREVLKAIQANQQVDPLMELKVKELEAKIEKILAEVRKVDAEATVSAIEGQYSAVQTAQALVVTPGAATVADSLLKSAGYTDHDAPPIIPQGVPAGLTAMPEVQQNTSPMFPPRIPEPDLGMMQGIEGGGQ